MLDCGLDGVWRDIPHELVGSLPRYGHPPDAGSPPEPGKA